MAISVAISAASIVAISAASFVARTAANIVARTPASTPASIGEGQADSPFYETDP